ncbi:MAG: LptF/LptG family permease [Crocinitomicaceae bacterium]
MLSILDKYIIKKFLSTFFFMMAVIMVLAMVFDLSERLGDFIEKKAPISAIIFEYYLNFIMFYGNLFSALIIFISVIWFTSKMAQNSEIIPMLNSGKPFTRILRPYMIAATLLTIISLFLNHIILPSANKRRLDFEEKYYRIRLAVDGYYAEFPHGENVYFSYYNSDDGYIQDFYIEQWNKNNKLDYFLEAKKAKFISKGKWHLEGVFTRKLGSLNDEIHSYKSLDTTFSFGIEDFAQRDNVVETMNYTELNNFIKREKAKGNENIPAFEIEQHQRTSYPFASYVLTLIGVSVSSRKSRGGIGAHIAIGLAFVFLYIFAMKITSVAAINVGFPPIIAVWLPNIMFGIVGLVLYKYAPK